MTDLRHRPTVLSNLTSQRHVEHRGKLPSRREALRIGGAALGLNLPLLLQADALGRTPTSPQAKSVIILYLSGGPSQLDMWDMKPAASEEVRGSFRPISTTVPGIQICEHMPRMATLAHKYTIIRSMSHNEADHVRAGYWVMTGGRLSRPVNAFSTLHRNDRPHLGSVTARERQARRMPSFVVVPEFVSPRGIARPGQHAGFLGARYDPYTIASDPNLPSYNPGSIHSKQGRFAGRVANVRHLITSFEQASPIAVAGAGRDLAAFRETAFDLVTSNAARDAFDLSRESPEARRRYGNHSFGQSALVARRLVEAGVRVVQVTFIRHDNGKGGQGYDSHSSPPNPPHLKWCKDELLPPTDAAFSALVEDLDHRGLLDETIVLMMGEFGRTPRFNANGGRDHWPGCYSVVVAGGGFAEGHVHGASDRLAAAPVADPVGPNDLLATIYRQLGIDHRQTIYDMEKRPHIIADGEPVSGLRA